jgi:hypothetical protein
MPDYLEEARERGKSHKRCPWCDGAVGQHNPGGVIFCFDMLCPGSRGHWPVKWDGPRPIEVDRDKLRAVLRSIRAALPTGNVDLESFDHGLRQSGIDPETL